MKSSSESTQMWLASLTDSEVLALSTGGDLIHRPRGCVYARRRTVMDYSVADARQIAMRNELRPCPRCFPETMTNSRSANNEDAVEHGISDGFYDNVLRGAGLRCFHVLECVCGKVCRGDDWADAGAALDEHLAEVTT